MNISLKKRWEIIFLSKHEYDRHMSSADISRYLRIDETAVRRWLDLSTEFADKLVDSMEKRVQLLIERKSDYINY